MTLAGGAVEVGACATTPSDGLVVGEVAITEEEVVHGALAGGDVVEGLEDEVDEALGGLDVAAHHGGGGAGGEEGFGGD